ncbi:MAG TPA: type II toxin-antitoxin system mRNA interferase toxin, RelE/StbE family [Cyanobacteria bacterium UBA11149]|nr:type II toxin-antitoxin system mRNA interferase toxin, RelE/StbE family [Cyanobacteria bacterium UBA11367]HBK66516.1 type II toxin-antitoxin system mRNA interferase toxin, RelE/StbE family [Cyanobacteria bacterium UBA11166]HBS70695.1 type II toxin-antitoxin system mRNA interferase toxin, RelE/StbE family [Cyanobacteria bacterium UBA11153]HBW90203.1 type II toxin-antitoxin system mRNA interferase toxin, RelE/StbE family [Cyanobacteria bacterium UBA11149]HCA94873.1 type II toxin-antitoxin syst
MKDDITSEVEELKNLYSLLYRHRCHPVRANQELEPKYKDHPLTGDWNGYRDCHIEPDWLLIYKISETNLFLVRSGSHSNLF